MSWILRVLILVSALLSAGAWWTAEKAHAVAMNIQLPVSAPALAQEREAVAGASWEARQGLVLVSLWQCSPMPLVVGSVALRGHST